LSIQVCAFVFVCANVCIVHRSMCFVCVSIFNVMFAD